MILVAKKLSKFEENSKIYIYSLVPQIDHPVALCLLWLFLLNKTYVFNKMDIWQTPPPPSIVHLVYGCTHMKDASYIRKCQTLCEIFKGMLKRSNTL